jgi:hypothetical protein
VPPGRPAIELLGQVLARVRQVVPFDASFWSTTDPATLLPTGGLVHNLPLETCQPYFDHELLLPDVNKFAEPRDCGLYAPEFSCPASNYLFIERALPGPTIARRIVDFCCRDRRAHRWHRLRIEWALAWWSCCRRLLFGSSLW